MQIDQILGFGFYRFDPRTGQLRRGEQEVRLTPKAGAVLRYLVERAGQVVTKEELFQAVWSDAVVSDAALTSCIQELRHALHDNAKHSRYIETIHRRGFRFIGQPQNLDAPKRSSQTSQSRNIERRLAAILSADVKGYSRLMSADEIATIRTLTVYREVMAQLIQQHRGRVVDSPGDNLLAEFKSVVDAVEGAVAIQEELRKRNVELPAERQMVYRIGINVGDVIVEGERIYGEGVNIAARLEGLAEAEGICISGAVHDQIKNKLPFSYEYVGERVVKNIAEPVRVYRVKFDSAASCPVPSAQFRVPSSPPVPAPHTQPLAPTVVGRDAELARLYGWLEKSQNGERQIVFVTGEPGIGKTTIVETFLRQLEGDDQVWIGWGQCVEQYGAGEAYLPVLEALGRLGREAGGSQVRAVLNQYAPSWLVQLPALLSPAEVEELQRRTAGVTRERMLREVAEAVEVLAAERVLILRFEDLHWSDVSTLDLLSLLARRHERARLLIVGTYRPVEVLTKDHPLKGIKQELQLHGQCEELALDFLSEAAVVEYLTKRFTMVGQQTERVQQLARVIHQRTDGNALFMVNVVNDLVAQRVMTQTNGGWELRGEVEEQTLGIPTNLRQLIEQQIERMSPAERAILDVASVAGIEFSAAAVAVEAEQDLEAVEGCCGELVRREQFLRELGIAEWPDGTIATRYGFIHALYQEVLYERLSVSRCMRVHRRIGEREEQAYGERAREIATELAAHFERGRDFHKAVQYRQHAAENAMRRNAYQEVITHSTKGLELLTTSADTPTAQALGRQKPIDGVQRCGLSLALGEAQWKAGEYLAAQETLLHAADVARALGATESLVRAGLMLATITEQVGLSTAPVVDLLEEALQALGAEDNTLTARTLGGLARTVGITGAQQQAMVYAQQAVAMARRLADPELLAANLYAMRLALQGPEHVEQGLAYATEVQQLAEAMNTKDLLLYAHIWRVYCLLELGDMPATDVEIDAYARLAEEEQQPFQLCLAIGLRAMRALMQGQFADSERLAQQAFALGQHLQTEHAAGIFGLQMFTLRREQGRLKEVEPVVRHFVQQHTAAAAWRPGLALIYSELGRLEEARAEFEHLAQHDFADLPHDGLWMACITYLADICTSLGDAPRAATLYQLLLPHAGHTAIIGYAVACYGAASRYLGTLAATLGRWDEAEQHFEDALAMNARMEARPWLAHTQHQYATMLMARDQSGDRKKAAALRKAALTTTRELGMRALEERLTA